MFKLSSLFDSGSTQASNVLAPGMKFPVEGIRDGDWHRGQVRMAVFISLHCAHCIDLLPHLGKFADRFDGTFALLGDGTAEDLADIRAYFNYTFPVLTS